MAEPTRAQFDAAAKKVMETAPDGLSREEFFALVDKEIEQSGRQLQLVSTNAKPLKEPTTFGGGFAKGLNDFMGEVGQQGLEGMAHPQTAGDFLSLLLPMSRIPGLKATASIPGTAEAVGNKAVRAGARGLANVGDLTPNLVNSKAETKVIDWLREFGQPPAQFHELPLAIQEEHLPQTPGPLRKVPAPPMRGAETPFHERPLYQQMEDLASPFPNPDRTRTGGGAQVSAPTEPSLNDVLTGVLNELRTDPKFTPGFPDPAKTSTLPPPVETAGAGPLKQSGKFRKSGQKGQAGGYSSGNPGQMAPERFGVPAAPVASDLRMDELIKQFGGSAPAGNPPASSIPETGGRIGRPTEPPPLEDILTGNYQDPSFLEGGDSRVDPVWHSGAEPDSVEAQQAATLHRETGELDRQFKQVISPEVMKFLLSNMGRVKP